MTDQSVLKDVDNNCNDEDNIMDYLEVTSSTNVSQTIGNPCCQTIGNPCGQLTEEEINDTKTIIIPGIDLGTTNSCISIWRNNNCEIIPDEFGNKTIPSYVSFTNVTKYVGLDAKRQRDINIENVFYEVKRVIGRYYNEKPVQDCKDLLSYKLIENERNCVSLQSSVRNNKVFTPEEISAYVLMKLRIWHKNISKERSKM